MASERKEGKLLKVVNSVAPIRICDNGGWTDTRFARTGKVFNIGVFPYVEVQMQVFERSRGMKPIVIRAENFKAEYGFDPKCGAPGKHPLLEKAFEHMKIPGNRALDVTIFSKAPAGCHTGTSAAVSVALIGALAAVNGSEMTKEQVANTAHYIETVMLEQECGIQDQICSAYGGINFIDMYAYPFPKVTNIELPDPIWWELERRLLLIAIRQEDQDKVTRSHEIHRQVIKKLEGENTDQYLDPLRMTAVQARDAVVKGDFAGLGKAMQENTKAQKALHPSLVSQDALAVGKIAMNHGAMGWKVNGAGGEGGSLTLLAGPHSSDKRKMIEAIEMADPRYSNIPIYLSRRGLRVWEWQVGKSERG